MQVVTIVVANGPHTLMRPRGYLYLPATRHQGTNTVAGRNPAHKLAAAKDILRTGGKAGMAPGIWDGRASQRIAAALREWLDRAADRLVA